jgi:hypothetical protein
MTTRILAAVLVLMPLFSSADTMDSERLELSREHFMRGETFERQGKLEQALVELELAEAAQPGPSVSAAIERVRARLGARHDPPMQAPVLVEPQPVVVAVQAPPPPPHRSMARLIAPILLAPLAIGALAAGGALVGLEKSDFNHLHDTCAPGCNPSDVSPLKTRQTAGYALIGVGAGLAAIDVILWAVLTRPEHDTNRAAIEPSLTSLRGHF